jgi:hypothetical protein
VGAIASRLLTNFSKGELTPLVEGRPDLAAFYEGGAKIENWNIMRQGGLTRRPGTRFIVEIKDSAKDAIIIPFETSVDDAYIVELGDGYARFIKNKAQLKTSAGGPAVDIISPYTEAQLRRIHFTQSVDVGFFYHEEVAPKKLNHLSDTNWNFATRVFDPPATFEADTDISGGTATLTPGAITGNGVTFTASSAIFLDGDVGRQIIFGASRGIITQLGASAAAPSPNAIVIVDIIDDFPDTNPISAGSWFLRLSPQVDLDPDHKNPIGRIITLDTDGRDAFRAADLGKYIGIYGGLLKITQVVTAIKIKARLLSSMDGTTSGDPPAATAGNWSMLVPAWSDVLGYPRSGDFYQGRLGAISSPTHKTKFWLSDSDNFDSYATGIAANKAVEYTMATKGLNQLQWMVDNVDMFVGTGGTEHRVTGGRTDEPLGGDQIPLVSRLSGVGCAPMQPIVVNGRIIFVDRSLRQIFSMAYSLEEDGHKPFEVTGAAEHITESGIRLGPTAFQTRPDPRIYYVREDGELIALTYYHAEKVIGFTRYVTDGAFEAVACIPQSVTPAGFHDQVYVIVKRTIDGDTKRYIEMFEPEAAEVSGRAWSALYTDCAKAFDLGGVSTTVFSVPHLIGETVDVVIDGSYIGEYVVSAAGTVTVEDNRAGTEHAEIGLHYESIAQTMRPAVEGAMVEGLPRAWIKIWMRVFKTLGGKVMGQALRYEKKAIDATTRLATGDANITALGVNKDDGKVTFSQDQPYPMTVLAVFGDIVFGDHS